MTLMTTSLLGTLHRAVFRFRLRFRGHELHCLGRKTASACEIIVFSQFGRFQMYLWAFTGYFRMKQIHFCEFQRWLKHLRLYFCPKIVAWTNDVEHSTVHHRLVFVHILSNRDGAEMKTLRKSRGSFWNSLGETLDLWSNPVLFSADTIGKNWD